MTLSEVQSIDTGILWAKDLLRLLFVACVMVISSVFADIYSYQYDITDGCDVTYNSMLETVNNVRSITGCCCQCNGNKRCLSVKYDPVNRVCQLNSNRRPLVNQPCHVLVHYAELIQSSSGKLINDHCIESVECAVPDSRCVLDKCQCKPGYSYLRANESCVKTCDAYGTTFTPDPGHAITDHADRTIGNSTPDDCMQACTEETDFECRTCEYQHSSKICWLFEETSLMVQTDYIPYLDNTLYQRNCK